MRRVVTLVTLLALASGCGERIADERGTVTHCHVHDADLQERVVPIQYGYPVRPAQEELDARKQFPYSREQSFGGCVVTDTSPKKAMVRYCPKCDEAAGTWKREYGQQVLIPLSDYLIRIREELSAEAFKGVEVFISRREVTTVLFEGRVGSAEDFARLKRLADAAKPPRPVVWEVKVSAK